MGISRFVKPPKSARDGARFVELFLQDTSARELFDTAELAEVVRLAKAGDWGAASREFRNHTGCDVQMSVFAAVVAARL